MAGTGRTTNYGLALYMPDNTVSMLNTFNNNMNVIDAGMQANKVLAQSASDGTQANTTNIQKIEAEIETVKGNVANNTTDIDGLKVNYQTLAGKVVNAEGDIADLDATTTELSGKVNLNTTKIGENSTEIEELKAEIGNITAPAIFPNYGAATAYEYSAPITPTQNSLIILNSISNTGSTTGSVTFTVMINEKQILTISETITGATYLRQAVPLLLRTTDTLTIIKTTDGTGSGSMGIIEIPLIS